MFAALSPEARKSNFKTCYKDRAWNYSEDNRIFLSGRVGSLGFTEPLRAWLAPLLTDLRVRSILDVGCGDATWAMAIPAAQQCSYTGLDIVRQIIEYNTHMFMSPAVPLPGTPPGRQEAHETDHAPAPGASDQASLAAALDAAQQAKTSLDHKDTTTLAAAPGAPLLPAAEQGHAGAFHHVTFVELDAVVGPLPAADLILCKNMLMHSTVPDALAIIENIIHSTARYVLFSTFPGASENGKDFLVKNGYCINLDLEPFCLTVDPVATLDMECGIQMRLYEISTLKEARAQQYAPVPGVHKTLFISGQDFANVNTDIAHALTTHVPGHEARVFCRYAHPFQYTNKHHLNDHFPDYTEGCESLWWARNVDVIVFADEYGEFEAACDGGNTVLLEKVRGFSHLLTSARWCSWQAGDYFRNSPGAYNDKEQALGFVRQIVAPDLFRLALPALRPIAVMGVPLRVEDAQVQQLLAERRANPNIVIGHGPTNFIAKGTTTVRLALDALQKMYPQVRYVEVGGPIAEQKHLSHADTLAQRDVCDLYIDQYNASVGGVGISSFECMARGIVPLCTLGHMQGVGLRTQLPQEALDSLPVIPLPPLNADALAGVLAVLVTLGKPGIQAHAERCVAWVKQYLDPAAFAATYADQVLRTV